MSGKLSEHDPLEWAKTNYNDGYLAKLLDADLRSVISSVLLLDGTGLWSNAVALASILQIEIEEGNLTHLDDKLLDSEDTLRDLILHMTQYTYAMSHLIEFIRRYTFARVDPNPRHKAAYRDNFPDL